MLGEYLDKFIIIYLNNIIIYFNSKEEYFQYIKQVLQKLIDKKILIAIKKYKFHIKAKFCGFIIKLKKLSIDLKKVKAIVNQQKLNNIIELRLFLRFYNYYLRFIVIQLKNIKPFTRLTKKNKLWKW